MNEAAQSRRLREWPKTLVYFHPFVDRDLRRLQRTGIPIWRQVNVALLAMFGVLRGDRGVKLQEIFEEMGCDLEAVALARRILRGEIEEEKRLW